MSRFSQTLFFSACLCLATACAANAQSEVKPSDDSSVSATNNTQTSAKIQSPVSFFRRLLAMNQTQRLTALTNRPAAAQGRILAKVDEYENLSPDERELRLRATDLRWWFTPMLRMTPVEQDKRLALVPEDLRPMIQSRLDQWRILPPPLQQEYLESDQAIQYLTILPTPPSPEIVERQKHIADQFHRFLELTPSEKQQTLDTLSDADREQMKETLKTFEHLSPQQRQLCVQNYAKFAGMSPSERAEFLKNADRWSKMTPEERQSWRDLVQQVPIWPAGWTPHPTPPLPPGISSSAVATNAN